MGKTKVYRNKKKTRRRTKVSTSTISPMPSSSSPPLSSPQTSVQGGTLLSPPFQPPIYLTPSASTMSHLPHVFPFTDGGDGGQSSRSISIARSPSPLQGYTARVSPAGTHHSRTYASQIRAPPLRMSNVGMGASSTNSSWSPRSQMGVLEQELEGARREGNRHKEQIQKLRLSLDDYKGRCEGFEASNHELFDEVSRMRVENLLHPSLSLSPVPNKNPTDCPGEIGSRENRFIPFQLQCVLLLYFVFLVIFFLRFLFLSLRIPQRQQKSPRKRERRRSPIEQRVT